MQVAPAELEGLLLTHPAVLDAAVVGLSDDSAGELPLAFVVKKPETDVTEKELEDFIAGMYNASHVYLAYNRGHFLEKVSPQKKLRGGVFFTDVIPKNPTGKILRRVLKKKANKLKSKL